MASSNEKQPGLTSGVQPVASSGRVELGGNPRSGVEVLGSGSKAMASRGTRRRSRGRLQDTQTEYVAIPTSTKRQKADALTSRQEEVAARQKQGIAYASAAHPDVCAAISMMSIDAQDDGIQKKQSGVQNTEGFRDATQICMPRLSIKQTRCEAQVSSVFCHRPD